MPLIERNINEETRLERECSLALLVNTYNPNSKTGKRIKLLFMLSYLTKYAEIIGVNFIIYDFYRTQEQQQSRYAKGRTEPGSIITNVDGVTTKSRHQSWHAFDLLIIGPDNRSRWSVDAGYKVLGEFWEELKGTWGGRWYLDGKTQFNDIYHFQI